jgi:hypothetical protein
MSRTVLLLSLLLSILANVLTTFVVSPILMLCGERISKHRRSATSVSVERTPDEKQRDHFRDRARDAARELISIAIVTIIASFVWRWMLARGSISLVIFLALVIATYAVLRHLTYMLVFIRRGRGFW